MISEVTRLDVELVRRGLLPSRSVAVQMIAGGQVRVDGILAEKPSQRVGEGAHIAVAENKHWVSRGAHKLIAALDKFHIDPAGQVALDAGASTGGFTEVLLDRGATRVFAVDVGHHQLAAKLQNDQRVVNLEGQNLRTLTRSSSVWDNYRANLAVTGWPSLIVADLSFISLRYVLDSMCALAERDADLVLLVKPQFEVGRSGVHKGVVREKNARHEAALAVLRFAAKANLGALGIIDSPIIGEHGNREYFLHLQRSAPYTDELIPQVRNLS